MKNCVCTNGFSGEDDIRLKERRLMLKEVYDELNHISEDLSCNFKDRSRIKPKCCAALLSLRCIDRKLRVLIDDEQRSPIDDLQTCFGCSAKLELCIADYENTKKKMEALRTEWYMQEEHMTKISSHLRAAEQELEMQSIYCTHQGLVLSRLLWKITSMHYLVEFVTSNCSSELEEILRLIDSCIYGFTKTYSNETANTDSEECQYLVALCGILTNISSVPDGRHFLMNAAVSRDIYDLIIKVIPTIATDDLKWLMLICIYNILGNPVGLKYAAKEERLCDALEECLAPYHTHRIIGTALRIAKYLVDDLSDQTYFITLFENLPIESIIQLIHASEPSVRKLAKTVITKIGLAFEENQDVIRQRCPPKPSKHKFNNRIVRRVPSRHSGPGHRRNIKSETTTKSISESSGTSCAKSCSKTTSNTSMTSDFEEYDSEMSADFETISTRTSFDCSTAPSTCLNTKMSVNKQFNACPSEKKMFVSSPSVAITAKLPLETKIKDSDTLNTLHKQTPCTDFSCELSKYGPSREPSSQSGFNAKGKKITVRTIYCTTSATKPFSGGQLTDGPSANSSCTKDTEDKSATAMLPGTSSCQLETCPTLSATSTKPSSSGQLTDAPSVKSSCTKDTEDKSTTVMYQATSSCQFESCPSHMSTGVSTVSQKSAPCGAVSLKSSTPNGTKTQTEEDKEDTAVNMSTSVVFTSGGSGVIVSLLSKLDLDNYLRPSYSGVGIPFKNKKNATVLVDKKQNQGAKPVTASKICKKDNKEKPKTTKFSSCGCKDNSKGAAKSKGRNCRQVPKKP